MGMDAPEAAELDHVEVAFLQGWFAARKIGDEPTEAEMAEAIGDLESWLAAPAGTRGP
jgi:hypothetical protein